MGYTINWVKDGVILVFDELLTFNLVMEANDLLIGNIQFDSHLFQIWDFKNVTSVSINKEDAITLAIIDKSASKWSKKVCVAILANINDRNTTFLNLYKSYIEKTEWRCAIFQEKSDMIDWLNSEIGKSITY